MNTNSVLAPMVKIFGWVATPFVGYQAFKPGTPVTQPPKSVTNPRPRIRYNGKKTVKFNFAKPKSSRIAEPIVTFPSQPWEGKAIQSLSPESLAARDYVKNNGKIYRIGAVGKSEATEGQFWAIINPNTKGYSAGYGVPKKNVLKANFIEVGTLKPGAKFITRPAPPSPDGKNPGGYIEVVTEPNGVQVEFFSHPSPTPYTGN